MGKQVITDLNYLSRSSASFLLSVMAGTLGLCNGGCEAVIDSGTTFIIGPFSDIERFQQSIPTYNPTVSITIKKRTQ
jgi:hypothetical protein